MIKATKSPLSKTWVSPRRYVNVKLGSTIDATVLIRRRQDQESIDFTDNDISILSNFPLSPRLQTLLCARNRIASIQPSLAKSIPNLNTLVLTQNNIAELADLDPLQGFAKLTHMSLLENPVTSKEVRVSCEDPSVEGCTG